MLQTPVFKFLHACLHVGVVALLVLASATQLAQQVVVGRVRPLFISGLQERRPLPAPSS